MVLRSDEVASCFQPRGTRFGGATALAADANDNAAAKIPEHAVSFEVDVRAKVMSRQRMGRSVVPTWGAPELRRYAAMLAIGMPRSRRHRWKFFQFNAVRAMPSLYMRLAEWKPNRPNARSGWRTSGCLSNLAIPHHRRKGEHRGAEASVLLAQNCPVTAGPRKLRDKKVSNLHPHRIHQLSSSATRQKDRRRAIRCRVLSCACLKISAWRQADRHGGRSGSAASWAGGASALSVYRARKEPVVVHRVDIILPSSPKPVSNQWGLLWHDACLVVERKQTGGELS